MGESGFAGGNRRNPSQHRPCFADAGAGVEGGRETIGADFYPDFFVSIAGCLGKETRGATRRALSFGRQFSSTTAISALSSASGHGIGRKQAINRGTQIAAVERFGNEVV